jgi:uncharacterized LabA/DUF88 family protein
MKIFLFIDGTNLYSAQYKLFGPSSFLDFSCFIKKIEEALHISFFQIHFYASYSPQNNILTSKDKLYLKNEALFYKSAKSVPQLQFFTGYRSKTSGKEKEVDVKLAVDIVDYCHQNKFDSLYFCSGDADFNHALQIVRRFNKPISLIGLETRIPMRLSNYYPTSIFTFSTHRDKDYSLSSQQKITFVPLKAREMIKKL